MIKVANFFAKYSCTKWNKNRWLRKFCRTIYRGMAELYARCSPEQRRRRKRRHGLQDVNTYPWPYRDDAFANWELDDSDEGYNLISDSSGFVIRHPTSFCAWKLRELSGKWPKRPDGKRYDAKNWVEYLGKLGYTEILSHNELESLASSLRHCIVVLPSVGEYGLVVWMDYFQEENAIFGYTYLEGEFIEVLYSMKDDKMFNINETKEIKGTEMAIWIKID